MLALPVFAGFSSCFNFGSFGENTPELGQYDEGTPGDEKYEETGGKAQRRMRQSERRQHSVILVAPRARTHPHWQCLQRIRGRQTFIPQALSGMSLSTIPLVRSGIENPRRKNPNGLNKRRAVERCDAMEVSYSIVRGILTTIPVGPVQRPAESRETKAERDGMIKLG
jgi:hypothetical protein